MLRAIVHTNSAGVRQQAARRAFSASTAMRAGKVNTGIVVVPQQQAYVVERWGKFERVLEPGLNLLVPFMHRIAYVHSLKVLTIDIGNQSAVFTKDNVHLDMDGVLYYQVYDPKAASYDVDDAQYAIKQLAMSTMRSEIGKLTLDETLRERSELNKRIVEAINEAVERFGVQCLRYEVRQITPPGSVIDAMELEVVAERRKRQQIIESIGERDAAINVAEGEKQARVLASEAEAAETINVRRGEATGVKMLAEAQAAATNTMAAALQGNRGVDAASLGVAQQYVEAFGKIAHKSNTMLLPSNANDPASMVAQAMGIFKTVQANAPNSQSANNGDNNNNSDDADAKPRADWVN
eukprot:TRINITY_DN280_c0_g3_i1.p1 TRINITY_DN280_c0_g3~~TRINITY_DN280_c0_g3_i1.p1  ORF type:complete len:365 (+),score=168.73 TRINITY_DN280_c0_g3_i1:42-1097(+)